MTATEEVAGEVVILEALNVSITLMGKKTDTLKMGGHIRRRARADSRQRLVLKRKGRQRRRARINNPLSQSHLSSQSRKTGSPRKVSRGTSI